MQVNSSVKFLTVFGYKGSAESSVAPPSSIRSLVFVALMRIGKRPRNCAFFGCSRVAAIICSPGLVANSPPAFALLQCALLFRDGSNSAAEPLAQRRRDLLR